MNAKGLWPQWTMLVIFAFVAFESILWAAALKGPWLILLAPGAVCGMKAIHLWRALRRQLFADAVDSAKSFSGNPPDGNENKPPL
jgi:hypothetical protein